jgi:hypothetical protein
MTNYNWDFFQIPHVGPREPDLESQTRTDTSTTIRRPLDVKISNFGALRVGPRSGVTADYTGVTHGFKSADELANPKVTYSVGGEDPHRVVNPYVWGSTVKKVRDDEFTMQHAGSRRTREPELPAADVMDTKLAKASGMSAPKKYPTEGWHSFGGKYDILPYNGVLK